MLKNYFKMLKAIENIAKRKEKLNIIMKRFKQYDNEKLEFV